MYLAVSAGPSKLRSASCVYEAPYEALIAPYQPPYRHFHGHCPAPCCFQNCGAGTTGRGGGGGHDSRFVGRPLSISHPASTRPLLPEHGSGCHFTGRFTRPAHHFSKEASFVKTWELCEILSCTQPPHPDRPFLRQPEHGGPRRSGSRDGLLTPRRTLKRLGLNGRALHGEGPVEAQRQCIGPVTVSRCSRRL